MGNNTSIIFLLVLVVLSVGCNTPTMKSYPILHAEFMLNHSQSALVDVVYEERHNKKMLNVVYQGEFSNIEQKEFEEIAIVFENVVGIADISDIDLITISELPLSPQKALYSQIICDYNKVSNIKWEHKCFSVPISAEPR